MTEKNNSPIREGQQGKELLEWFSQLLSESLNSLQESVVEKQEETPEQLEESGKKEMRPDLSSILATLHSQWDISRKPGDPGENRELQAEDWYRKLSEINRTWDIRTSLDQLQVSQEILTELQQHYPEYLKKFLGYSPSPHDEEVENRATLKTAMQAEMADLHNFWNIDQDPARSGEEVPGGETAEKGFKGLLKRIIKKSVRLHTDPVFQRQRDFNSFTVAAMEKMVTEIDSFQRRISRSLMELTNRQFLFNLTLIRFIDAFLQDVIMNRQKSFNAEVVQAMQKILVDLPDLIIERTEILVEKLHADLEQFKQSQSGQ